MADESKPQTRVVQLPFEVPNDHQKPRRTRRYTGEKLDDRIPLVQALVTKDDSFFSIAKHAKQLKISRHSVRGIARRMREEGYESPEQVERIIRPLWDRPEP